MAATLALYQRTGTTPGTEDGPLTGFSLLSADDPGDTLADRVAHPVAAGTRSFSRWLFLKLATAPDNQVSNFKIWCDSTPDANLTYKVGVASTYATPSAADNVATANLTTHDSANKLTWDAGALTTVGDTTDYAVLVVEAGSAAAAGNASTITLEYSWDEV